ncbi:hypothetical protein KVR01_011538 [Diaporthe batatas]|uniref:uncharacterized protein n=1 Tax=Diaporthe batatas TaxID=748121 RepID=UPI001D055A6B|nr:uncharacterized protein KVR01_011538 [Diaporthe batatas]KAG8158416.1 hypothetical protein KVR01_011538 [Diaporthe batatas]
MADSLERSSPAPNPNCRDEIKLLPDSTSSPSHSPGSISGTEPRRMNQKVKRRRPDTEEPLSKANSHFHFGVEVGRANLGGVYLSDRFSHRRTAALGGFSFNATGVDHVPSEQRREYIKHKSKFPTVEQSDCYVPRVHISDQAVTKSLIKIAQEFSFLDHFFADCFGAFEKASNHIKIREDLSRIRNDLAKYQNQSSGPSKNETVYIGSLGQFCENVFASWVEPASSHNVKAYKNGLKYGEEYLVYLRDTLEVPYWQLIIDLLLDWRESNTSNTLGTAILYMLQYKALSCTKKVEDMTQMTVPNGEDGREIAIMRRSIQKRLDVLHKAVEVVMLDEGMEIKAAIFPGISGPHPEPESGTCTARLPTKHNVSLQLALFILFVILAFIPGYQGFAISTQRHEIGATSDSDFYYLIQSSIMSVLGNFATALPLLQSGPTSGPSIFFWVFSAMGLFSAVLAVVIYPLATTGWSSVVSFIGNVASAASLLVLTVATAREQMSAPISRSNGEHLTKGYADQNGKKKQ